MSLLDKLIELLKFYWSKRAKPYVRVSLAVVAVGASILAASPVVVVVRALWEPRASCAADPPWWVEPATGLAMVILGIVVFVAFYLVDPDRRKVTPPSPSVTITPGQGWTFEDTALAIGQITKTLVVLEGFSEPQRRTFVFQQQLRGESTKEALENLRAMVPPGAIPDFDVVLENNITTVRMK